MPEKLPKGWVKTKLGEVCLPVASIQPDDFPDAHFTYFDIGGIDNERNLIAETKIVTGRTAPSRARQLLRKNDILFSTVRTYLRKIALVEREYPNPVASTGFAVIRAAQGVSSNLLFFQVLSEDFLQPLHELQTGSSYPAVRAKDVFAQSIVVPPTAEQERLVAKLRPALSGVERAETATRRAQERLRRYRAAVLDAAVTGKLTRAWRESQLKDEKTDIEAGEHLLRGLLLTRRTLWEETELKRLSDNGKIPQNDQWKSKYPRPRGPITKSLPELPSEWIWASLEQVSTRVTVGYVGAMKNEYVRNGIPFLRSQNVRPNRFEAEGLVFIRRQFHTKLAKSTITPGDVVVVRSGVAVGTACVIPEKLGEANCSDLVLIQGPLIKPDFISFYMNSAARRHVELGKVGIAQPHFNTASVASLSVPLPPVAEQTEIVLQVKRRLAAADRLATTLDRQLERARATRQSLLQEAFAGRLVPQNSNDEPASVLLESIRAGKAQRVAEQKAAPREVRPARRKRSDSMQEPFSPESLRVAWRKTGRKTDARVLFDEAGFGPDQVGLFYEVLRGTPEVQAAFQEAALGSEQRKKRIKHAKEEDEQPRGSFRLVEVWLEDFKNLKDYTVRFNPTEGVDVVLGWNGTGKSNLFEALVIIFRDLHGWLEKDRWRPDAPMHGFRLSYEMDEHIVQVVWRPMQMKRPELKRGPIARKTNGGSRLEPIKRDQLPLPRFVFGYYSGPTNRLAEHFLPMKQAHYERLRTAKLDDAQTLASLLEQRRFFCAETHHAKYVLLAFCYKEDPEIARFLEDRLRIASFESALFIIRKPRWHRNDDPKDFWGATGIMRRVMERLREFSIAPMVVEQTVTVGYNSTREDHYYFFLPDLQSLHAFAAEYANARTFFLALESTDFSELIHDVEIQVRVKATSTEQIPITFRQLSEGEQQLLMVLGLMRFTKSHQSLVLLDEPDTHLNPHWSVDYLKDLGRLMSDNNLDSTAQYTSQVLMATHDPLVIASLVKEQIHLLKRDPVSLRCYWEQPSENPRGLGFTGILTSDMFGFRSDLDPLTMELLDRQVNLAGKEQLNREEAKELERITQQVEGLGFKSASSDPYYRAFVKAIVRRQSVRDLFLKPTLTRSDAEALRRETDGILAEIKTEETKTK